MNEIRARTKKEVQKVILLYDSMFGNTKKVALTLGRGLEAGGLLVDAMHIKDFKKDKLEKYDIIGIGGPTHMHGTSKSMKSFLSTIKHQKLLNKKGFVFETKASFPMAGSAAKKILAKLKKMKVKLVYPKITGIVSEREGPLEEGTLIKMEQIGLEIADILSINSQTKENREV